MDKEIGKKSPVASRVIHHPPVIHLFPPNEAQPRIWNPPIPSTRSPWYPQSAPLNSQQNQNQQNYRFESGVGRGAQECETGDSGVDLVRFDSDMETGTPSSVLAKPEDKESMSYLTNFTLTGQGSKSTGATNQARKSRSKRSKTVSFSEDAKLCKGSYNYTSSVTGPSSNPAIVSSTTLTSLSKSKSGFSAEYYSAANHKYHPYRPSLRAAVMDEDATFAGIKQNHDSVEKTGSLREIIAKMRRNAQGRTGSAVDRANEHGTRSDASPSADVKSTVSSSPSALAEKFSELRMATSSPPPAASGSAPPREIRTRFTSSPDHILQNSLSAAKYRFRSREPSSIALLNREARKIARSSCDGALGKLERRAYQRYDCRNMMAGPGTRKKETDSADGDDMDDQSDKETFFLRDSALRATSPTSRDVPFPSPLLSRDQKCKSDDVGLNVDNREKKDTPTQDEMAIARRRIASMALTVDTTRLRRSTRYGGIVKPFDPPSSMSSYQTRDSRKQGTCKSRKLSRVFNAGTGRRRKESGEVVLRRSSSDSDMNMCTTPSELAVTRKGTPASPDPPYRLEPLNNSFDVQRLGGVKEESDLTVGSHLASSDPRITTIRRSGSLPSLSAQQLSSSLDGRQSRRLKSSTGVEELLRGVLRMNVGI